MKLPKKLLLVLASSFLLVGCNNTTDDIDGNCPCPLCPILETTPEDSGEQIDPAQEELRKVVRNKLNEIFDDAKKLANDSELLVLIENYRPLAIADVDNLDEMYEEEEAIDLAYEIADKYASGEFKEVVIAKLNEYFVYAMSTSKDPRAVDYLRSLYERDLNRFNDEGSFEGILNLNNYLVQEIKNATGVTPSCEDFSEQKDEVCAYGYEILYAYIDFLPEQPGRDYIESELLKFADVTGEENANALVNQLKAEIYAHFLDQYKNELCNDFRYLLSELKESMTNEEILKDVELWVEADIATIGGQSSFEKALKDHDGSLDALINEVESAVHRWGIIELEKIQSKYDLLIEDAKSRESFFKEYGKAEGQINSLSPNIVYLEKEIKEVLTAFETFCKTLVPEE